MKRLILVIPLVILGGCQVFSKQIDKAAEGAGKAVTFYCDNVTSQELREEFRAKVNEAASPNSIVVTCANGKQAFKSN